MQSCSAADDSTCCDKLAKWAFDRLYKTLTFGLYIRSLLEMTQVILIFSIYEIFRFRTDDVLHIVSLVYAMALVCLYVLLISFAIYLIFCCNQMKQDSHSKFEEFFCGLKQSKSAQFYVVVFLCKNAISIA